MGARTDDLYLFQDIMNREKEDQLPLMQVGFIDSICLPIYEVGSICYCYSGTDEIQRAVKNPSKDLRQYFGH